MTKQEVYKVWKNYHDIPAYQQILHLMNKHGYISLTEEDFDNMHRIDDYYDDIVRDEEEHWRTTILPVVKQQDKAFVAEIDPDWQRERRLEYLETQAADIQARIDRYDAHGKMLRTQEVPFVERDFRMGLWNIEETYVQQEKVLSAQVRTLSQSDPDSGLLADKDIEKAREYPLDSLIDFDKRGFAVCPFHEESSASFSYWQKNNLGHCFGCLRTADSIAVVMTKERKTFPQAVRHLLAL